MEPAFELTECTSGGWNAQFDPDRYDELAGRIRQHVALDVDTDHMLLWHMDDVKISFVRSSGTMTVRTDDREQARELVRQALASG